MIRINLLREPSQRKTRQVSIPHSKWVLGFIGLLALEVLVLGAWYYSLQSTEASQLEQIQTLQTEQQQLATLQAELQRYQQEKQQLDQRLRVVERLQANRTGPVSLMNAIVSSVPDAPNLWLTSLTQRGNTVTIEGRAFAVAPIAEFIANLSNRRPIGEVDLDFWEREEQIVNFKVTCALEL